MKYTYNCHDLSPFLPALQEDLQGLASLCRPEKLHTWELTSAIQSYLLNRNFFSHITYVMPFVSRETRQAIKSPVSLKER